MSMITLDGYEEIEEYALLQKKSKQEAEDLGSNTSLPDLSLPSPVRAPDDHRDVLEPFIEEEDDLPAPY